MKNLKLKFVFATLLVTVIMRQMAFAFPKNEGDPKAEKITTTESFVYKVFNHKDALKFKLVFRNVSEEKVIIRILDQNGQAVHKEVLKNQEVFHRNYDMSQLGAGVYKVEIKAGELNTEQEVALGVSDNQLDKTFQAYVSPTIQNNTIRVLYKNGKDVYISIKDKKGNVLFQESSYDTNMYAKKYDVSTLKKGTYTLALSSGKKTITKVYTVE